MEKLLCLMLLIFIGCKPEVLPSKFDLKKEKSFYFGLFNITTYSMNNICLFEVNELDNYPKFKKFKKSKWSKLEVKKKPYINLINHLNSYKKGTNDSNNIWLNRFVKNINFKEKSYYISGLYKEYLGNGKKIRGYYYYYIIDEKNKIFFEFDISKRG